MNGNVADSNGQERLETVREAAIAYADYGLHIFPVYPVRVSGGTAICTGCGNDCGRVGKHPAIPGWQNLTLSVKQVEKFWSRTAWNIGLHCDRYVVLDIDPKNGGLDSLTKLQQEHGNFVASTASVVTGSGGFHFYFNRPSYPVKQISGQNVVGVGIDTRRYGGYVILPPSNHVSGNDYEWMNTLADGVKDLPDWLGAALRDDTVKVHAPMPGVVQEGSRDATITTVGGALRRIGCTEDQLYTLLSAFNDRYVNPPLKDSVIQYKARYYARRWHPAVSGEAKLDAFQEYMKKELDNG